MRRRARMPLWAKLATFAALGVAITHTVHLLVTTHLVRDGLVREQETLGRGIARLVAREAAEAILVDDRLMLRELVDSTVAGKGVSYCAIVRDERLLASSLPIEQLRRFIQARRAGDTDPLVLRGRDRRVLDVVEPILEGRAGVVRLGLDMRHVTSTTSEIGWVLGQLALLLAASGLVAAFVVGRELADPLRELVEAAERFDPAVDPPLVRRRGNDEISELTERFNGMMVRLKSAHEEQSRARQKQAETERMAALGALVAGVAHEVNNPLAGLKNCLRRLQRDDGAPQEKTREYLEMMEEGLERIEDVMRGLLDFARPRSFDLRAIATSEIVREGTNLVRPILARRGVALRVEDQPCTVVADPKQAGQALLNLVINASHVTPDGGAIRIRGRSRNGLAGLAVEDDGPGIPAAIRDRVLDPFFSTKPEGAGTGLGLSVTKSILDAHGGELTLEFPRGGGTVATIWFRVAD